MSLCVLLPASGAPRPVRHPQRRAAELLGGGGLTIVGALPALDGVVVAAEVAAPDAPPHRLAPALHAAGYLFDGAQRGDLLVVGSDDAGEECDLDAAAVCAAVDAAATAAAAGAGAA